MEKVKQIIGIKKQLDELDAQTKKLKAEFDAIETEVIGYLEQEGLDRVTLDGRTVSVRRQLWASVKKDPFALDILRDNGLGDFIEEKVNSQRISSYVREFEKNGQEIPNWCNDALNISEKFNVSIVKAGG
ncbi:MAG: hypothetical protein GXY18_03730 [Methanomicrobiales archaeon]|nr:hypothetical protein [Methanomicrobiales archaeon]